MLSSETATIPVVYACDDNYVEYLACSIASLLKNKTENEFIKIFILIESLKPENIKKLERINSNKNASIEFIKISKHNLLQQEIPALLKHISITTYFRLLLPELLPEFDKVIYLDCDTNVLTSLTELYNTDISNYYIAGVPDMSENECCERLNLSKYVNAGVLLLNLKELRLTNVLGKLFEHCNNHFKEFKYADQDIINITLQDKILYLDRTWNAQTSKFMNEKPEWLEVAKNAKVIHYLTGFKPWRAKYNLPYKKIFLEYLELTPWKHKIILYKFYNLISFLHSLRKNIISIKWNKEKKIIKIFNKTLLTGRCNHNV